MPQKIENLTKIENGSKSKNWTKLKHQKNEKLKIGQKLDKIGQKEKWQIFFSSKIYFLTCLKISVAVVFPGNHIVFSLH